MTSFSTGNANQRAALESAMRMHAAMTTDMVNAAGGQHRPVLVVADLRNPRASADRQAAARAKAEAAREEAAAARARAEGEAAAARATAEAAAAERKTNAERETLRLQNEEAERKREAEQRKREFEAGEAEKKRKAETQSAAEAKKNSWMERGYQVALNVAAPVGGLYVGHKVAKAIEARHEATQKVVNKEIAKLGARAKLVVDKAGGTPARAAANRLAGIVSTADRLKLLKGKGPAGFGVAAFLIGEGLFSRFVLAPQVKEIAGDSAADAVRSVGTASAFSALGLLGERQMHLATPKVLPDSVAMSNLETARQMVPQYKVAAKTAEAVAKEKAKAEIAKAAGKAASKSVFANVGKMLARPGVRIGGGAGVLLALGAGAYAASQTEAGQKLIGQIKGAFTHHDSIEGEAANRIHTGAASEVVPHALVAAQLDQDFAEHKANQRQLRTAAVQAARSQHQDMVYVKPFTRADGEQVKGYWRRNT